MTGTPIPVSIELLRAMPLPALPQESDKDARGRVMVIAGGPRVPGAPLLTGLAALRVGAGKLKLAALPSAALMLGLAAPEAAVVQVPAGTDDEIGLAAVPALTRASEAVDALVIGPGMMGDEVPALAAALAAAAPQANLVLDAAALKGLLDHSGALAGAAGRLVLTPHAGEMAGLLDWTREAVLAEPERAAREAAVRLGAVVALKGNSTRIAAPDGRLWLHTGGVTGLGTSGSGDVLAGIIGGLLARGAAPPEAAIRGVFIHGRAGKRLAATVGALGFLAREIVDAVPASLADSEA